MGIKVTALFGSPNRNGSSSVMHEEFLSTLTGCDIDRFQSFEMKIHPCNGCGYCKKHPACILQDDMNQIYDSIRAAEIISISWPVYFSSFPAPLKAIIDRCQVFWEMKKRGEILTHKQGVIFASAGGDYKDIFLYTKKPAQHLFTTLNSSYNEEKSRFVNCTDGIGN